VALDVPTRREAEVLVRALGGSCRFYKVGLELYAAEGPSLVSWLTAQGAAVFVDLKLHDIPNTVRGAARSVARTGASLLTVHAVGGEAMMRAAVQGAAEGSAAGGACTVLAVTVLTSMDEVQLAASWGRSSLEVEAEVVRLAGAARGAGVGGVVCSGHELAAIRAVHGEALPCLVPGIRLAEGTAHDQRRVMTPGAAAEAGARWIILGRAVTAADDPPRAMEAVLGELRGVAPRS
jgi:orotidine-5'-phosphate decarboxylase